MRRGLGTGAGAYHAEVSDKEQPAGVESVLQEIMERSTPVQHSAQFDDLVALIDEELRAQIAMGRLGEIHPPAAGVRAVAVLVGDMVDRVYHLRRRARPGRG
jgi:hypothetical protein